MELVKCRHCNRKFFEERIQKHEKVCIKAPEKQKRYPKKKKQYLVKYKKNVPDLILPIISRNENTLHVTKDQIEEFLKLIREPNVFQKRNVSKNMF